MMPCMVAWTAAAVLLQMLRASTRAACCGTRRVLLWGHGIGGFVGTALLEARGSPYLYQHDDFRSIS
jgi:hypothetical protein